MYQSEIKENSSVTVSVGIGKQVLEFNTKALQIYENCIYLEPIRQNNKMIGFSTPGLILSIIVPDPNDGKAYKFSQVKIRNIKTKDGNLFHEVTCPNEGKVVNRRGACRVWLGEEGIANIGLSGKPIEVIVKDISVSGIAFICDSSLDIEQGTVVHISFFDEASKTRFSLAAIIVRCEEMDRGRIMYGCRLNNESNVVAKFVTDKQREKLRATRTVGINA